MMPSGAYTGDVYAVFTWDDGDRHATCEATGPALSVIRDAYQKARAASPAFDHVEVVAQTITHGEWKTYAYPAGWDTHTDSQKAGPHGS